MRRGAKFFHKRIAAAIALATRERAETMKAACWRWGMESDSTIRR